MTKELIRQLRDPDVKANLIRFDAADLIERQAAEIAKMREAVREHRKHYEGKLADHSILADDTLTRFEQLEHTVEAFKWLEAALTQDQDAPEWFPESPAFSPASDFSDGARVMYRGEVWKLVPLTQDQDADGGGA